MSGDHIAAAMVLQESGGYSRIAGIERFREYLCCDTENIHTSLMLLHVLNSLHKSPPAEAAESDNSRRKTCKLPLVARLLNCFLRVI